MKVEIWHNILWSRYKAVVFSELGRICCESNVAFKVFQIAETNADRIGLSGVEREWHQYDYELLYEGSYASIPKGQLIRRLARQALVTDADVIALAGFERLEFWVQLIILRIRGKKIAFFCDSTIHDNVQKPLKGLAKRLFFGLTDMAFCYGIRAREYLMYYGMKAERIRYRCQAAALPRDYDPVPVLSARQARPREAVRVLYVGRLATEKRIDTLLKAFKAFLQIHGDGTLVIVGTGPEELELKQLAEEMGIIGNVGFVGSKSGDALWAEYQAASCLVLPSRSEPWGLVVNEALAYGCPVIVSDRCGCVPELVIEGKTGYVFECDNDAELLARLVSIHRLQRVQADLAQTCIDHIAAYSPANAAREIYLGLECLVPGINRRGMAIETRESPDGAS